MREESIYRVRTRQEFHSLLPDGVQREVEPGLWVFPFSDDEPATDSNGINAEDTEVVSPKHLGGSRRHRSLYDKANVFLERFTRSPQTLMLEDMFQMFSSSRTSPGVRWVPETQSFIVVENSSAKSSQGLRVVVIVTAQYLANWSVIPPQHNAKKVFCCFVLEVLDTYPLSAPRLAVLYFQPERPAAWYETPMAQPSYWNVCVHNPQQLTALSVKEATALCIGEPWSPVITLDTVLTRALAVIREQVICHYCCDPEPRKRHHVLPETEYPTFSDTLLTSGTSSKTSPLMSLSLWKVVMVSIFLRVLLSYQPHSGQYNAPEYGDYEAQRHWKEITRHMPLNTWYTRSTGRWEIDYPPLTAYHEWIMGYISHWFSPESVANTVKSFGYLTPEHKIFMRASVLVSDVLVFHSSAIFFFMRLPDRFLFSSFDSPVSPERKQYYRLASLLLFLTCPPFILIDHVHFQYNSVPLGLILWAVNFLTCGYHTWSLLCVVAAILYKQTFLYFLPAFAAVFLGLKTFNPVYTGWLGAIRRRLRPIHEILISLLWLAAVALMFGVFVVLPFLIAGLPSDYTVRVDTKDASIIQRLCVMLHLESVVPILVRIFPFHRGLYEDYVSNLWVALQPVLKLNKIMHRGGSSRRLVLMLCSSCTALAFLPACTKAFRAPSLHRTLEALFVSSLSFYLFSVQVHEKAILLPLLPALLMLTISREPTDMDPLVYCWICLSAGLGTFALCFGTMATFSLLHLMQKDHALPAAFGLWGLWLTAVFLLGQTTLSHRLTLRRLTHFSYSLRQLLYRITRDIATKLAFIQPELRLRRSRLWDNDALQLLLGMTCVLLLGIQLIFPPPRQYPYLHVYFQSAACAGFFLVFWAETILHAHTDATTLHQQADYVTLKGFNFLSR